MCSTLHCDCTNCTLVYRLCVSSTVPAVCLSHIHLSSVLVRLNGVNRGAFLTDHGVLELGVLADATRVAQKGVLFIIVYSSVWVCSNSQVNTPTMYLCTWSNNQVNTFAAHIVAVVCVVLFIHAKNMRNTKTQNKKQTHCDTLMGTTFSTQTLLYIHTANLFTHICNIPAHTSVVVMVVCNCNWL